MPKIDLQEVQIKYPHLTQSQVDYVKDHPYLTMDEIAYLETVKNWFGYPDWVWI